eukprot:3940269-Rhodomonas_salina.2
MRTYQGTLDCTPIGQSLSTGLDSQFPMDPDYKPDWDVMREAMIELYLPPDHTMRLERVSVSQRGQQGLHQSSKDATLFQQYNLNCPEPPQSALAAGSDGMCQDQVWEFDAETEGQIQTLCCPRARTADEILHWRRDASRQTGRQWKSVENSSFFRAVPVGGVLTLTPIEGLQCPVELWPDGVILLFDLFTFSNVRRKTGLAWTKAGGGRAEEAGLRRQGGGGSKARRRQGGRGK